MTPSLGLGDRPIPSGMGGQGRLGLRLVSAAHSWMHADVLNVNVNVNVSSTHKRFKGGGSSSVGEHQAWHQIWSKGTYSRSGGFPVRGWPAKSFRQLLPCIIVSRANAADAAAAGIQRSKRFKSTAGGTGSGSSLSKPSGSSVKISKPGDAKYIAWWEEKMAECQKSSTKALIKRLGFTNLLGLNTSLRMGSLKEGSIAFELLTIKRKYPHELILCRIGEFYETLGFDACLLVEYAGLNPMGGLKSDAVPKAGCPIVNLRQTLDDLTDHGFSVCVVEEVKGPSCARQRKERFIGGHAHPGSPYVYGLAEADLDVEFPDPVPVIAIGRSALGYKLITILEMMRTISIEDQLTEEAVVAKLRAKCYQRLFLHKNLKHDSTETVRWGEFGRGGMLWAECREKHYEWYESDPVSELLSRVRELYDLDANAEFRTIVIPLGERPRPLYVGTAAQVGVLPTEGVPSLLKVLLPDNVNGLCTSYLRDLLLNPPPHAIAAGIQGAVRLISSVTCSIPDFICVSAAKLVKLIGAKEANHIELARLKSMAEDVLQMDREPHLREILNLLLDPTWLATGLRIGRKQLLEDCNFLVDRLGDILAPTDDPENDVSKNEIIPDEFFQDMEVRWKGRVRRAHVEEAYAEVDRTAVRLAHIVDIDFTPIVKRTRALALPLGGGSGGAAKAEIVYSRENKAVLFKGKRFHPSVWGGTPGEEEIKRLKPAVDAKGKKLGDEWYTSQRVDEALNNYRFAVEVASDAVFKCLKDLAQEIQSKMNTVVFVSSICIIAKTLFSHVSEAKRRRWVVPAPIAENSVTHEEAGNEVQQVLQQEPRLYLEDLFPYWLDKTREQAVLNTVEMSSMFLLTGPNGGGKSSVLRSVCAAALLATCGLMVPCRSASVPRLDSIMLRMMISDSPADGKSSFQMEMSELRSIASEATPKSLVLYDELCKGTEVNKGTCIVASVLEHLDRIGCMGVISTHLHDLLDMQLKTKSVVRKAMGTELVNGHLKPTWKLVDGECRESLAFETARKEGVPNSIVDRAEEFYKEWNKFVRQKLNETGIRPLYLDTPADVQSGLTRILEVDEGTTAKGKEAELSEMNAVSETSSESGSTFYPEGTSSVGIVSKEEKVSGVSPQEALSAAGDSFMVALNPLPSSDNPFSVLARIRSEAAQEDVFLKSVTVGTEGDLYTEESGLNDTESSNEKPDSAIEKAFVELCQEKLCQLQSSDAVERIASRSPVCFYVGPREKPPPAITNCSCVYILRQPDGRFYVGQTDNLSGRISVHRTKFSQAPFYYIPLPNKSVACEVETFLIHQLRVAGFSLANSGDQYHLYFGTGSPPF